MAKLIIMKNIMLLMLVVVLICSSCLNAKQEIVIEDDTPNYIKSQETRSIETVEIEPTGSVSAQCDKGMEIIYDMPDDIPIYIKPETVDFTEIGQMEYFAMVIYERLNPSEPYLPDYWRKEAFIGADTNSIDKGCAIYETINAFYKKKVEKPDGVYDSDQKITTNASIMRVFTERSVLNISTDGEYVLCQTPDYSAGKYYMNWICELFHEDELVDSDMDYDALLRRIDHIWNKQELTGVYKIKNNDRTEFEVSDGQISLARLFFEGNVNVEYYDREKLFFRVFNSEAMDGFFCIKYGETEAELLFLTTGGSVSPDGKYYITTTQSPYELEKVADELDGYYIMNIENAKVAFIPTGTYRAELYTTDTWVSKDGLYSLYDKLLDRKIADTGFYK